MPADPAAGREPRVAAQESRGDFSRDTSNAHAGNDSEASEDPTGSVGRRRRHGLGLVRQARGQARTGYEWSKKPSFRRLVDELRHRVVDRAIGKMTKNLNKAVDTIIRLMKDGQSDSVKLGAARLLIEKLIDVQSHSELEVELRQLNERLANADARFSNGSFEPFPKARRA